MTDVEALALGNRAVVCKSWRWMPGMRLLSPDRYEWVVAFEGPDEQPDSLTLAPGYYDTYVFKPDDAHVPDLRDPATLGCLLALVRETAADLARTVGGQVGGARVHDEVRGRLAHALRLLAGMGDADEAAEILVAALEAG